MKTALLFCFLILTANSLYSQSQEVPYTLDDRDRLIRVEEQVKALDKRVDEINSNLNRRIDDLMNLMLWGFGITFAGMFTLIGFVIWNRRTAVAPVARDMKKVKEILTELAKINPDFSEILKRAAI